jgi:hypothetical protein
MSEVFQYLPTHGDESIYRGHEIAGEWKVARSFFMRYHIVRNADHPAVFFPLYISQDGPQAGAHEWQPETDHQDVWFKAAEFAAYVYPVEGIDGIDADPDIDMGRSGFTGILGCSGK